MRRTQVSAEPQQTAPDFEMTTSGAWCCVSLLDEPLDPAEPVDAWIDQVPGLEPYRDVLTKLVGAAVSEGERLEALGVMVCAAAVEHQLFVGSARLDVVDSGFEQDGVLVTDTAAMADMTRATMTPEMLETGLADVRTVTFGSGVQAVRMRTLAEVPNGPGAEEIVIDWVRYLVPTPGGQRLVVLDFETADLVVSDELVAMFDEVAESFRWAA
jgi:hypothetical protein